MANVYYKGEVIFLYTKFFDINNNPAMEVKNPKVRILHCKDDNIYEDLPWSQLSPISNNEYYFNYLIPFDSCSGMYDVIYYGEINGKVATIIENFHIIDKSETYSDAIKLYGYVDNSFNHIPLANVSITLTSTDNIYNTQTYTKENGYWEAYIYPGNYICSFTKEGFKDIITNIQLGNENNEMQFNNISLESNKPKSNGSGSCKISDSFILKNGIPLDGLKVEAFDIINPKQSIAKDYTNNRGVWEIFLDPGNYFIKITGNSMDMDFDRSLRLKVNDDLTYNIEDMEGNKAIAQNDILGPGTGSQVYRDKITDKYDNPIMDVQINVLKNNVVIAQTYTDAAGKYELHLDKGEYMLDIYHPSFNEIPLVKITV